MNKGRMGTLVLIRHMPNPQAPGSQPWAPPTALPHSPDLQPPAIQSLGSPYLSWCPHSQPTALQTQASRGFSQLDGGSFAVRTCPLNF